VNKRAQGIQCSKQSGWDGEWKCFEKRNND
jgi:hypothetical protein